jgi:hypothetical protein
LQPLEDGQRIPVRLSNTSPATTMKSSSRSLATSTIRLTVSSRSRRASSARSPAAEHFIPICQSAVCKNLIASPAYSSRVTNAWHFAGDVTRRGFSRGSRTTAAGRHEQRQRAKAYSPSLDFIIVELSW